MLRLSSLSPAAAIQVQITPRTGEVSIGDSKLFLCQGKNSPQLLRTSPANAGRCAGRQTASSWSVDGKKKLFCSSDPSLKKCLFAWKQSPHWSSLILPAELQTFCDSTSAFSVSTQALLFFFAPWRGVVFSLTTNLLLVLSSNYIDEKKDNLIFFLFVLSFHQMIHCLTEQMQMIQMRLFFCSIFGLILKRL